MKVAFHTLGCKVNQYETEALREIFVEKKYEVVDDDRFADAYVINTCSVTSLASRKSRQAIRRLKKLNPDSIVAVTGCYAQASPDEVSSIEGVDIVIGTKEKLRLLDYLEQYRKEKTPISRVTSREELDIYEENLPIAAMESRTRAFIKVQDGCDRFCSYCIIPYARGPVRSRSADSVVKEALLLIEKGFKEIILTGINTALYGTEKGFSEGDEAFQGIEILINRLNRLPGDFRIRLSSLEPTAVDVSHVKRLIQYEKLCRHLHLSVQSGSDRIIGKMNRNYTMAAYQDIVRELLQFDPEFGISTDIIVGFPGEEAPDFEDSIQLVRAMDFCKVHVFPYSKRLETAAASMENQIAGPLKKQRTKVLLQEGEASAQRFFVRNAGKIKRVLLEEYVEEAACYTGYSDNYIKVYIKGCDENRLETNAFYMVQLTQPYRDGMLGNIV